MQRRLRLGHPPLGLSRRGLPRLAVLAVAALVLASCHPPSYSQAYPDARNSGPFWEREEQRD
jgi:hypothetical protein